MPAGAKILPLRSNIPAISQHCFTVCDESFPNRALDLGKSIVVGGANYGQGSSMLKERISKLATINMFMPIRTRKARKTRSL